MTLEDDIRKLRVEMKIFLMSDAEKEKYMRTDPGFLAMQAEREARWKEMEYQASGEADYDKHKKMFDQMGLSRSQAFACIKEVQEKRAAAVQMQQSRPQAKQTGTSQESDILNMYRAMGLTESQAREAYRSVQK